MRSATSAQLDSLEALLGLWTERVRDERDNRLMDLIGQNSPSGSHCGEMA